MVEPIFFHGGLTSEQQASEQCDYHPLEPLKPTTFEAASDKISNAWEKGKTWGKKPHPKAAKTFIYTLIALATLSVLIGTLFLGMHFGGLGISKAGFHALVHKIAAKDSLSILYEVALPIVGGSIAISVVVKYGPKILHSFKQINTHKAINVKVQAEEELSEEEESYSLSFGCCVDKLYTRSSNPT